MGEERSWVEREIVSKCDSDVNKKTAVVLLVTNAPLSPEMTEMEDDQGRPMD